MRYACRWRFHTQQGRPPVAPCRWPRSLITISSRSCCKDGSTDMMLKGASTGLAGHQATSGGLARTVGVVRYCWCLEQARRLRCRIPRRPQMRRAQRCLLHLPWATRAAGRTMCAAGESPAAWPLLRPGRAAPGRRACAAASRRVGPGASTARERGLRAPTALCCSHIVTSARAAEMSRPAAAASPKEAPR